MNRFFDFVINVVINMMLGPVWGIAAAIALVLHFLIGIPLVAFWALVGFWVAINVLETAGLGLISRIPTKPQPPKKNVNPYTKSNKDYPPLKKRDE